LEVCFTASGGAPPMSAEVRYGRKLNKMHNWDNDSYDDNHDNDDHGMDWAIALTNNITGNHNSSANDRYHHDGDDGDGCDGGDGGGGGGDGGGGE